MPEFKKEEAATKLGWCTYLVPLNICNACMLLALAPTVMSHSVRGGRANTGACFVWWEPVFYLHHSEFLSNSAQATFSHTSPSLILP